MTRLRHSLARKRYCIVRNHGCEARGFTLVEVAIALAILAIALVAVSRATQASLHSQELLRERTLAQWVAQNRVSQRVAEKSWISPGTYHGIELQAGREYRWRERVSDTPNPALRRVDVTVTAPSDGRELATLVGFIALERM
jgi:general secretion pathway protein I